MTPRRRRPTRRTKFKCAFSALLIAVFVAFASPAGAQGAADDEAFNSTTQRGYDFFDAGNYAAARAEFEKAYQMRPDPLLLFNIASTHRREGKDKVALAYYTKFLDVAPKDHIQRRQAEEVTHFLREKIAAADKKPPTGDETVVKTGPEKPPKPGTALIWSGIGAGAIGVAGIVYAMIEGQRARDRHNALEELEPGTQWSQERIDQFEEGESAEKRAIVFSILGTAAVATGATLFVIGMQKRKQDSGERQGLTVMPYATDDQAGLAFIGRF